MIYVIIFQSFEISPNDGVDTCLDDALLRHGLFISVLFINEFWTSWSVDLVLGAKQ